MNILAIRGQNLASLAGDFEVDFTAEPLASAGVFAITGPTGAGKSTLLDALSLALFHDTPRLKSAGESGVKLPDGKDGTISPQDARNILRRGTGHGFAEVDYIGLDGQRWRARWETRRARERADGKLQPPSASLQNLQTQQQHGGKLLETREAITTTTGLSYEQFCRSILLAQNEFAAFLRANGKDRAELLEALTGTEIYRLISKKCHERTNQEKRKVEAMEAQLGANPPLPEDMRTELEQQLEAARAVQIEREAAQQALQREANWHPQGRDLQKQHTQLQTELEANEAAHKARADDSAQVQRMEVIEPARPLYRDLKKISSDLSQHEQKRSTIDAALARAEDEYRSAEANASKARKHHEAAEADQLTRIPAIRRARELDQQIGPLSQQLVENTERITTAANDLKVSEDRLQVAAQASADNETRINAWSTWQTEHPAFPTEEESWQQVGNALNEALRTAERAEQADQNLKALAGQAEQAQSRISQLKTTLESAREKLRAARVERQQAEQQERAIDARAIEQQQERLANRLQGLERLEARITDRNRAHEAVAKARETVENLQREQSDQNQRVQVLDGEVPAAGERAGQARKAWEASSAIANQHSAALRRQLVDGEPCPVCGSCEHPGHAQSEDEISRLVEELATQLTAAEAEHRALENEQTALKIAFEQAERQLKTSEAELAQRQSALNEATQALQQGLQALELDSDTDPRQLPEVVTAQRTALDLERTTLEQRRSALDEARQRHAQACEAATKAETAVEAADFSLKEADTAVAPTLKAYNTATHELEYRTTEAQKAREAVCQTLSLESEPDAEGLATLNQDWHEGDKCREDSARAKDRQPLLVQQVENLQHQIATQANESQQLREKHEALSSQIEALRTQRVEQLGDRDPDAVEAALGEAVETASAAMKDAEQALRVADGKRIEAQRDQKHWLEALETRRAQQDRARAELAGWLADNHANPGLALDSNDLEGLITLLAVPDDDWKPLREELRSLEQAMRDNRTGLDVIAKQIQSWRAQALSDRDEATVTQLLDEAKTASRQAIESAIQLNNARLEDDKRKTTAAEQLDKIRQQQAICDKWMKLDSLIGSGDGSKFRNYAQQFTLDVLITHANAQLRMLAPRYRLQRGQDNLNILVVDDDMGGETRGVHSLSGGETFLASLALALGLAELSSKRIRLESLFIDEGFGSLDADTLRVAMDALDRLQSQGRKVGVISHVQEMSDRIGTQLRVERTGPGRSKIHVDG